MIYLSLLNSFFKNLSLCRRCLMICGFFILELIFILIRRIVVFGDINLLIYDVIMRIDIVFKSLGIINVVK